MNQQKIFFQRNFNFFEFKKKKNFQHNFNFLNQKKFFLSTKFQLF